MRVLFPAILVAIAFAAPVGCFASPIMIARSLAHAAVGHAVTGKLIIKIDTRSR